MALAEIGKQYDSRITLIEKTVEANEYQKRHAAQKVQDTLGDLSGKSLAILGLFFKPNTDDMRDAPSITILNELAQKGATFKVYDPIAYKEAKWRLANLEDKITYCGDEYEAMEGCHALIIITEWNQFRNLNFDRVKQLLIEPNLFDFRNIYRRDLLEGHGFKYVGTGQGRKSQQTIEESLAMEEVAVTI